MIEKAKESKGSITEEDTATLLQRYTPTTVLALLQEVAHSPDVKIDWNRLVAKTSTGISNAREYQMLWRHLAYREPLVEKIDDGVQPLDDDSDLEYEEEAFPALSGEASAQAAAVKVLRGDFIGDRTPGQLSQRRKNIRKQNRDMNVGGSNCGKLSEAQLATRHAMSIALNMPNITANTIGTAGTITNRKFGRTIASSNSVLTTAAEAKPESQQGLNLAKPYQMGLLGSTTKSPVISKKTLPKLYSNNDGMVRATAVAAGARIACPSDAASLLKAAQANNAVHVMPTVASSTQSSLPGGMSSHSEPQPNIH